MNHIWTYTIYGLLAGVVGTGAGGAIAFFTPPKSRRFVSFILEYAAGLMLAVVCFDILPHAFSHAALIYILLSVCAGIAFSLSADSFFHFKPPASGFDRGLIRTGYIIMAGIALHNFPEGLAIGSGLEIDLRLGVSLIVTIILHDVPEGMATAAPLRAGGYSPLTAMSLAALSGVPTGFGALIGALAGGFSQFVVSLCLAFAGGAMLYVVFIDMIPQSKRLYGGRFGSLGSIFGMLTGMIVSVSLG